MHVKSLVLALALVACGRSQAAPPSPPAEPPTEQHAVQPLEPPPAPGLPARAAFPITIRNATAHPIVLETSGCDGDPEWLALRSGSEPLQLQDDCECAHYPEGICPLRVAGCYESTYAILEPGGSFAYRWGAEHLVLDPELGCGVRRKLASDQPIEVEVCWLDQVPSEETRDADEPSCMMARSTLAEPGLTLTVTL